MKMSKLIDLTNQELGRLKVLRLNGRDKRGRAKWECICKCGKIFTAHGFDIRSGHTQSCGCLNREIVNAKQREWRKTHEPHLIHGESNSRLYAIFLGMKDRCNNSNDTAYKNYGGRGIKVCDEWKEYINFHNWAVTNGYTDNLTIDRKDNDGNYCPENCRWATYSEQANNTRTNVLIFYNNEIKTLSQWAHLYNISVSVLSSRLKRNWTIEEALSTVPSLNNKKHIKRREAI
jgi:hypothetical protein